jgi:RNA 3'-terminal phosphate cyclase (ATP)
LLHTLYLPLALAGSGTSELTLQGGTHVPHSPCYHFLETTWKAYLEAAGVRLKLKQSRTGFYPRGGGVIHASVPACPAVKGLHLASRGTVRSVSGFSAVASLPATIARRQAVRAFNRLQRRGLKVEIREETWPGGPGSVLALVLDTTPAPTLFFALGARGKPAERVADEAVDQVAAFLDAEPAAVDPYSADQLVLPLALANGPSEFTVSAVTQHLVTNLAVIRWFLPRQIDCEGELGKAGSVRIH